MSGSASVTIRQRGGSGTRREGGTALLADGPLGGLRRFPVQVRALASHGNVAQLAEQAHDKRQVNGPIPFVSTIPTGNAEYLLQQILILSNTARCLFARSERMNGKRVLKREKLSTGERRLWWLVKRHSAAFIQKRSQAVKTADFDSAIRWFKSSRFCHMQHLGNGSPAAFQAACVGSSPTCCSTRIAIGPGLFILLCAPGLRARCQYCAVV